jgi:hypothetical protein
MIKSNLLKDKELLDSKMMMIINLLVPIVSPLENLPKNFISIDPFQF